MWTYIKELNGVEQYQLSNLVKEKLVIQNLNSEMSEILVLSSHSESDNFNYALSPNAYFLLKNELGDYQIDKGPIPDKFSTYESGDERNIAPNVYSFIAGNYEYYTLISEK